MRSAGRFGGKSVIVTGAASGIGRAAAIAFAREGASVVCADQAEAVEAVAAEIGDAAVAMRMDAADEEAVVAAVALATGRFGGLDVMIANAGISGGLAGLFDTSQALIEEVLRVNVVGPFLALRHAAPAIAARGGGAIVLTASVAGLRSGAGGAAYSASKAAVINLAQTGAQQLSGSNVRVNALCPGLTETGMTQMIFDGARAAGKGDRIGRLNPLRRGASAEELAASLLFLASDEASYVNGHALVVDGGLSSSHPFTRQEYGQVAF